MSKAITTGKFVKGAAWRVASVANRARIVAKDLADRRAAGKTEPTIAERQMELREFYDRYENFVETLCDAAQYGPHAKLAASYAENRAWILANFGPLEPYVTSFLMPDDYDAFSKLFAAEDLGEFLREDDGLVIGRITLTREALSLYAEHLRQLAARKAA